MNDRSLPPHDDDPFAAFLDEFAASFARISAPDIDREIEAWLRRLCEFFGADRSSLSELVPGGFIAVTHAWSRPGIELATNLKESDLPWLGAKLRAGEMYVMSGLDDIPAEAIQERALTARVGIKANVVVPLMLSGKTIGAMGIACIRQSRKWPVGVLQRLRLVSTVFANALARKRAVQEYLRVSRTLEHAGRVAAVGQLAASFAHEIKQPLGASLTNAQTALKLLEAPQPDLAEIRAALEDIVADNRRAGDIVHELRRFLRRQEPTLAAMDVAELLDTVVRFVTPEARNQNVEVRVEIAASVAGVLADRIQVQQVLINLLLNSFDALGAQPPERRRIRVTAAPAPANRVSMAVSDSGPGVPEHLRASLFEPFVTSKPQGLGIGLAIAQTLVGAHESRLAYSDAVDGGAVFTFSLAAAPPEAHGA
jgi:signal transduction histidine kinase